MGGMWRYRVAKDEEGKLHFVYARYHVSDPTYRCGLIGLFNELNEAVDIEDMRSLARQLMAACDEPIIPLQESGDEGGDEDSEDSGYEIGHED